MIWLYLFGGLAVVATVLADLWTDSIDYRLAANISLIYVAASVSVFTLLYGFRSAWRNNRVGRVFLTKSVIFSVFLTEVTVAAWWDVDYPGRQHVRYVLYTLAAITYVAMVVVLLQEQRRKREIVAAYLEDGDDGEAG